MDEKQLTIGEINSEIAIHMKQLGYEETTIDRQYLHYFLCTAHFYRATGRIYNNPDITAEYLEMQREATSGKKYPGVSAGTLNAIFITNSG